MEMPKRKPLENGQYYRPYSEELEQRINNVQIELLNRAQTEGTKDGVQNIPCHENTKEPLAPFENVCRTEFLELSKWAQEHTSGLLNNKAFIHDFTKKVALQIARQKIVAKKKQYKISQEQRAVEHKKAQRYIDQVAEQIHAKEQDARNIVVEMENQVNINDGRMPTRIGLKNIAYVIIVIALMLFEFPLNYSAMVLKEDVLTPLFCGIIAFALGAICAGAAHLTGSFIAEEKNTHIIWQKHKYIILFLITPAILILIIVSSMRFGEGDGIMSLINIALVMLAISLSYLHSKAIPKAAKLYFAYKKEYTILKRELDKLKKQHIKYSEEQDEINLKNSIQEEIEVPDEETYQEAFEEAKPQIRPMIESYTSHSLERIEQLYFKVIETYRMFNTNTRVRTKVSLVPYWDKKFDEPLQ